jgi:hypothetical protein
MSALAVAWANCCEFTPAGCTFVLTLILVRCSACLRVSLMAAIVSASDECWRLAHAARPPSDHATTREHFSRQVPLMPDFPVLATRDTEVAASNQTAIGLEIGEDDPLSRGAGPSLPSHGRGSAQLVGW